MVLLLLCGGHPPLGTVASGWVSPHLDSGRKVVKILKFHTGSRAKLLQRRNLAAELPE